MKTTVECNACGFENMPVKVGKGGTYSGRCPECGAQLLVKSPSGVAKMQARLGAGDAPPGKPGKAAATDDLLNV